MLYNEEIRIDFQGENSKKWISADFLRGLRMFPKKVRGIEVMRLSGDKVNPHNRVKKNWLCRFVFDL
jgi:hypothetical protein